MHPLFVLTLLVPALGTGQAFEAQPAHGLEPRLSVAMDLAAVQRIVLDGNPGLQAAEARVE